MQTGTGGLGFLVKGESLGVLLDGKEGLPPQAEPCQPLATLAGQADLH